MRMRLRRSRRHAGGEWDSTPVGELVLTAIDTETTGLHPRHGDRLLSLGAVRVVAGAVVDDTLETLVDPGRPIPPESTLIHGLDATAVAGAPSPRAAVAALRAFIGPGPLVGHQVQFDIAFLEPVIRRAKLAPLPEALDTMLLSAVLWPDRGVSHGLDAVAARLGVTVRGRHTALGDARATADILVRQLPLLECRGLRTFGELLAAGRSTSLARKIRADH